MATKTIKFDNKTEWKTKVDVTKKEKPVQKKGNRIEKMNAATITMLHDTLRE